jgi:hypothetical protein
LIWSKNCLGYSLFIESWMNEYLSINGNKLIPLWCWCNASIERKDWSDEYNLARFYFILFYFIRACHTIIPTMYLILCQHGWLLKKSQTSIRRVNEKHLWKHETFPLICNILNTYNIWIR